MAAGGYIAWGHVHVFDLGARWGIEDLGAFLGACFKSLRLFSSPVLIPRCSLASTLSPGLRTSEQIPDLKAEKGESLLRPSFQNLTSPRP